MSHTEPSPVRGGTSASRRRRVVIVAVMIAVSPLAWWVWGRVVVSLLPWWVPRLGSVEPPPLPPYRLDLSRRPEHDGRDERPAQVRLRYDEVLTVAVKPREPVVGAVEIKAFLERDGALYPWAVSFEVGGAGLFLLRAPAQALPGLAPGSVWRLAVLVGRPGRVPSDPDVARRTGQSPDWTRLDGVIEIESPDAGVPAEEM